MAEIRADHVAIYIRWSTDDQASGTTLQVQRELCELYLRSQGWQLRPDLVFVDDGFSGGTLDRPAMSRLRSRVTLGEVDCVVVLKIDRLSRNIVDAVSLVLREWQDRCFIKAAQQPIDTTTDLGRTIFSILATFADFERSQICERTQSGKTRRIQEGLQLHGEPAFGYSRNPLQKGVWVENPAEADLVRTIFRLACAGKSAGQICRQLNAQGLRTRQSKQWSIRSILWILHNRLYIGEVTYGRTSLRPAAQGEKAGGLAETLSARGPRKRLVRIRHPEPRIRTVTRAAPRLIDPETFVTAETRLRQNQQQRQSAGSRGTVSPYLLVGLARCPCGGALIHKVQTGRHGRTYRHYICHRSRQGGCSLNGHIPGPEAEAAVEAQFVALFGLMALPDDRFAAHIQKADQERKAVAGALREAVRMRTQLIRQRRQILQQAGAGRIPLEHLPELRESAETSQQQVEAQLVALRERLNVLDQRLESLQAALCSLTPSERWNCLTAQQKRQLLRMALTDRITIAKPKGSDELTIEIPWAY